MKWMGVIAGVLFTVGVLTAGGVLYYRPKIEKDLLARTTASLKSKEIALERASFEGRDGALVIEKNEALSAGEVRKAAESVFGVRVAKVEEITKEEPSLIAERIGAHLRLSGKLPGQTFIEPFVNRAQEVFGAAHVQHSIEESAAVRKAPYLAGLVNFLQLLAQVGPEAKLSVEQKWVVLAGLVPDAETKLAIEKLAKDRVPAGLQFRSELSVPERQTSAVVRAPDLDELLEAIRLNFEYDSTRLTQETAGNLRLLKQTLVDYQLGRIRILGYTDSKGSEKYNLRLGLKRAASIRHRLTLLGIARDRFEIEGRGETEAVADNSTEEGRQLNRRVAFELAGEK